MSRFRPVLAYCLLCGKGSRMRSPSEGVSHLPPNHTGHSSVHEDKGAAMPSRRPANIERRGPTNSADRTPCRRREPMACDR